MVKDDEEKISERGASQNLLLGFLVALLAVFGYLYFFTGMIKQREVESEKAPPPQQLKHPIPPRPDVQGQNVPVKPSLPLALPVSSKPAGPPKPPSNTAETMQPSAVTPPQVIAAAKPASPSPAKSAEKPEAPKPKPTPVKPQPKVLSAKVSEEKSPVFLYKLETVDILSAPKAQKLMASMKSSGFLGVGIKKLHQERLMKRLFVAELSDYNSAIAELEKLKKITDAAFILPAGGKYNLYAGSYDQVKRAKTEMSRLAGRGVKTSLRDSRVKLPVYRVTGQIKGKYAAEEWVKRLRKQAVESHVHPVVK